MELEYPTSLCVAGMNIYEFDHKVSAGLTSECQASSLELEDSGAGITDHVLHTIHTTTRSTLKYR